MTSTGAVRDMGIKEVSFALSEAFSTAYLFAKKPTTADTVALATAATDQIVGVAQKEGASGEQMNFICQGFSLITCGESISVGDPVRPGTGGKAYVADSATDMVVGYATQAGASGEKIEILLVPNIPFSYFTTNSVAFTAPTAIANAGVALKSDGSDKTLVIATGNNDEVVGVGQHTTTGSSQPIRVDTAGVTNLKLGETVAVGDKLRGGTLGKGFVADEGDNYFAIALEAGDADETVAVLLVGNKGQSVNNEAAIKVKKTTIPTASVLTLNSTPVTLVAAPGAGYAIAVHKIIASIDYVGAAYATNTTLEFRYTNGSGTKVTADIANLLAATADKVLSVGGIEAELVLTANAAVVAYAPSGNPATGDSDVDVTVIYSIVSI